MTAPTTPVRDDLADDRQDLAQIARAHQVHDIAQKLLANPNFRALGDDAEAMVLWASWAAAKARSDAQARIDGRAKLKSRAASARVA